jgi:hypothetical protein
MDVDLLGEGRVEEKKESIPLTTVNEADEEFNN